MARLSVARPSSSRSGSCRKAIIRAGCSLSTEMSIPELRRYIRLQMEEDTGAIENLRRRVRIGKKTAAFVYKKNGKRVIEWLKHTKDQ
jgi:hypothetical protein